MIFRALFLVVICALLSACAGSESITVSAKPIDIDVARTADPPAVQMNQISFKVVNKDNIDSFLKDMSENENELLKLEMDGEFLLHRV